MPAVDHAAEVAKQISDLIEPLRKQDDAIERELSELKQQTDQLRSVQTKVRAMIRAYDPEYKKRNYKTNGAAKKVQGSHKYSPERVNEMYEWLKAHAEELNVGDGFWGTDLHRNYGDVLPIAGQSSLSAVLLQMHDMGLVRLSKLGGKTKARKYYKVVV